MKRILLLTAFLAFSAANHTAFAGQSGEPQYLIEGLHCDGGKYGLTLPSTLPELLAIAPVLKEEVQAVEKWEGYTATRKTIQFAGLTLNLITFSNDAKRYSLSSAEIRSAAWAKLSPFHVDETIQSVRNKFGKVAEMDDYLRSTYTSENESVRFESKSEKVKAVIYECYTG